MRRYDDTLRWMYPERASERPGTNRARPHIPVDRHAPLKEFAQIPPQFPVFRVMPADDQEARMDPAPEETKLAGASQVVTDYLTAYTSGEVTKTLSFVSANFSFRGPAQDAGNPESQFVKHKTRR
jgi:hypothetical protein